MLKLKRAKKSKSGFTLIEVVISLFILTLIALGTTRNLFQTRQIAESNIRESTAVAIVSGYIEQIKSMEFEVILDSVEDTSIPLPTRLSQGQLDPIILDQWNTKNVVIDMDQDTGSTMTMNLYIFPVILDISGDGLSEAVSVQIDYAWENVQTGKRVQRTLRTQRSYVPTF